LLALFAESLPADSPWRLGLKLIAPASAVLISSVWDWTIGLVGVMVQYLLTIPLIWLAKRNHGRNVKEGCSEEILALGIETIDALRKRKFSIINRLN
jgi:hypothetical protein